MTKTEELLESIRLEYQLTEELTPYQVKNWLEEALYILRDVEARAPQSVAPAERSEEDALCASTKQRTREGCSLSQHPVDVSSAALEDRVKELERLCEHFKSALGDGR